MHEQYHVSCDTKDTENEQPRRIYIHNFFLYIFCHFFSSFSWEKRKKWVGSHAFKMYEAFEHVLCQFLMKQSDVLARKGIYAHKYIQYGNILYNTQQISILNIHFLLFFLTFFLSFFRLFILLDVKH